MHEFFISPELIASLAVLVTALTGLWLAIKGQAVAKDTKAAVVDNNHQLAEHGVVLDKVVVQTNGSAHAIQDRLNLLEQAVIAHHGAGLTLVPAPPAATAPAGAPTGTEALPAVPPK